MSEYREIYAKAVVGKGRKFTQSTHSISPAHKPTSVLGCWIINHDYEAKKSGNTVEVHGRFDVNLWYSHNDNTKTGVETVTETYVDVIKLKYRDDNHVGDEHDIVVKVLQAPNCLEASISPNGSKILVQCEREHLVEMIGETKVCVKVNPEGCHEDDHDWDADVDDEEFEDINPDFFVDGEEE